MTEYKKQTDEVYEVTLESEIIVAEWGTKKAAMGLQVKFEVWTNFVGNGSEIEIKIQDKKGKTHEKIKGQVYGDYFADTIVIPEKAKEALSFSAKLADHGLEKKSGILKLIPAIKVTHMKWGQKEAQRGDIVTLSADIDGVSDGTEVKIYIYEYDQDGAHDFIVKFPVIVKNKKIEAEWEFEYHEDTDDIPTDEELNEYGRSYNPPEYFFIVNANGGRFGENQESGLLEFKDWVEVFLLDEDGNPVSGEEYTFCLADGTEKKGSLDSEGYAKEEDIPPGKVSVVFTNIQRFQRHEQEGGRVSTTQGNMNTPSGKKSHFRTEPFIFSD